MDQADREHHDQFLRLFMEHYVNGKPTKRERLQESAKGLLTIDQATIGNWSGAPTKYSRSSVRNFNGCLDELIVFGAALSEEEIKNIYQVGRP